MDHVCRFCLSISSEHMCSISENSELLFKISSCLKLDLSNAAHFPKQICSTCDGTVEKIYDFHKKVTHNQQLLRDQLNINNSLLDVMKVEPQDALDEEIAFDCMKIDETKIETAVFENVICRSIGDDDTKDPTVQVKNEIDTTEINKTRDKETPVVQDFNYSSDDESLSAIKKTKEIRLENKTDSAKQKRKNKKAPLKKKPAKENTETATKNSLQEIKKKNKDNLQKTKQQAQENKETATGTSQHKCLTCFELFSSNEILTKHYKTQHKPKNVYLWTDWIDKDSDTFTCKKCKKVFATKASASKHGRYCSIDGRPYLCNLCGRTYKTVTDIMGHSKAHGGVKYMCSFKCGYSTVYFGGLKYHEQRHKNEYKYKCEECGKGFQVKTWFEQHQNEHTGARPYCCDICGLSYHLERYLMKHRATAHPQSSKIKRYICLHCSLPCDTKNALKLHYSAVHEIKTYYLCDVCGMTSTSASHLHTHKARHLQSKPNICKLCNKSFTTKSHLRRHLLTHSGVKSHACTKCGKQYAQRWTLQQHNLRYHNTSFYKCTKCENSFTTLLQLTKHKKVCLNGEINQ